MSGLSPEQIWSRYLEQGGKQCPKCQAFGVDVCTQGWRAAPTRWEVQVYCYQCHAKWVEIHCLKLTGLRDIGEFKT